MRALNLAAVGTLAIAIGLAAELAPGEASAAFRVGGGGGGHFAGGMFRGGAAPLRGDMFHGGSMPIFRSAGASPGVFPGGAFGAQLRPGGFAFAGGERHAFAFDRGRRDFDFRHGHRRVFFVGGPFLGFGYGYYGYDCSPYWNGYRWVYPYGYGYACGYGS